MYGNRPGNHGFRTVCSPIGLLWRTTCSRLRPSLYRARCQVPGSMYSMKPVSWRPFSSRPLGALTFKTGSVKDLGSAFPSSSLTKSNWQEADNNSITQVEWTGHESWTRTRADRVSAVHRRWCVCCWVNFLKTPWLELCLCRAENSEQRTVRYCM